MKKLWFLSSLLFCFIVTETYSQKNKSQPDSSRYWQTYANARLFNDLMVAKGALFNLISLYPENKNIYDSLANIYFLMGAFPQAILAGNSAEPTVAIKEIKAYSYRGLGEFIPAIDLFQELFNASGSVEHGYQLASLQFTLRRYGESELNIEKVINNSNSNVIKVVIATESGENSEVSYLAAAYNLKGVLLLELGKKDEARLCFEKAIAENPEFSLAKLNLESITKEVPAK